MTRVQLPLRSQAENGAQLCFRCGLCCDGSVFDRTPLSTEEVERAQTYGLEVMTVIGVDGSQASSAQQPCPLYRDGRCSTHGDWRPAACSAYACRLLDSYLVGERSLDACLDVILTMRETVKEVAAQSLRDDAADSRQTPESLLARAALQRLEHKYFIRGGRPSA